MATLAGGVLVKLLEAAKSGEEDQNPPRDRRAALLQVTDIVPAELDEKELLPKHGFYLKLSDGSHSAYASLPYEQDDLVLGNKIQLGQFIQVEKLEPGSPVPVMKGARPVPGRHPLVGTPEPVQMRRRGSWEREEPSSTPARRRIRVLEGSAFRTPVKNSPVLRKSSSAARLLGKNGLEREVNVRVPEKKAAGVQPSFSPVMDEDRTPISLPGKLKSLAKEAVQQRDIAQKAALRALRDATASETLVRLLKTFSDLSGSAKAEAPAETFERFIGFHQEITQAAAHMETILATTSGFKEERENEMESDPCSSSSSILMEISQNSVELGKRRAAVSKSACFSATPKRKVSKTAAEEIGGPPERAAPGLEKTIRMVKKVEREVGNWFVEFLEAALDMGLKKPSSAVGGAGKRGKVAAQPWVCPQALLLKVVNWLEVEHGDSSKGTPHPKASQISRKLRIKVKNP